MFTYIQTYIQETKRLSHVIKSQYNRQVNSSLSMQVQKAHIKDNTCITNQLKCIKLSMHINYTPYIIHEISKFPATSKLQNLNFIKNQKPCIIITLFFWEFTWNQNESLKTQSLQNTYISQISYKICEFV